MAHALKDGRRLLIAWPPEGLGSRTLLMYAGSHATQAADNALATIG